MKKLLSLILTLVLLCSQIPAASATNAEAQNAANILYDLGLFKGTGINADGTPTADVDGAYFRNKR